MSRRVGPSPYGDPEDDAELEAEEVARDLQAWERAYLDDRSWEALQEDERGLLRPLDVSGQQREKRRKFLEAPAARIRRGMIRYLFLVVDLSRAAAEMDFKPSRMAIVASSVETFIREFFDQNPLSNLGIIVLRDGVAIRLMDLSGSPEAHIKELRKDLSCSGDPSIQNGLDVAREYLEQIPTYGNREVLMVYSALSTCDPGDVFEAIERCKEARIRCSVVGLAAEIYICRQLCEQTGGTYGVAMDEGHLKELLFEQAPPPPTLAENAAASLVRMGFPQRGAEGTAAICVCHLALRLGAVYMCPRCRARVCELPTECQLCGLTLVSSPHLARSYHHLFPIPPFEEVVLTPPTGGRSTPPTLPSACFGCQSPLPLPGDVPCGMRLKCGRCGQHFCFDCDAYIHESLHNCPGCECTPTTAPLAEENGTGTGTGM